LKAVIHYIMSVLLEREELLESLRRDLLSARQGAGRTVLISGEAGIGKTFLLEHFLRENTATRVLSGGCEALFAPHPLGPLHDLAREACESLQAMLGDGTDRAVLFGAVLDELQQPPGPALLVLEDIHWADTATLDLIKFLVRRIHRAPALMILTYRDDELDSSHLLRSLLGHLPSKHVTRLALPRLSATAVATLAAASQCDAAGVYAVTSGNPFFVTEILSDPEGGVPATVRDAVLGRASVLKAAAREVLELTSLVPRAIELRLLESVLGPALEAVEQCVATGLLLAVENELRFRHELARVAVEQSIGLPRSQYLHARILAVLTARTAGEASLSRLVHHAQLAQDSATVLRLAPQAAREAAARGSHREAAAHCRMALAEAHKLGDADRAELLEEYAGYCFELSDLATAIPARATAIEIFGRLGHVARQCESTAAHAMPLVRALRNADADLASKQAIALAEQLPPARGLAKAYATESYLRMLNRDCEEAIAWGEKAIELARRFDDQKVLAAAHTSVGAALMFVDYPRGCAFVNRGLEIAKNLQDGGVGVADAFVMLGTASGEVYRFEEADRFLRQGIAFARAHDLDRVGDYMEAWLALSDMYQGRWDAAGERANAVLARELSGSTNRLTALVALGRLRTRRGDPGATEVLDEALKLASLSGTLQRVAPVRCARAEAAWMRGDLDVMRHEVAGALTLATDKKHPWFIGELSYLQWQAGQPNEPPPLCAEPYALQMRGQWQEAADVWEKLGCAYEQARALAEGPETAQRMALGLFDSIGGQPMAERLRQQMRAAGVRAVPRGPRLTTRDNIAGLTTRELEVLTLLGEGLQNAEIAQRLSRSPRTVEHHLAAILAKLMVDSRGQAVQVARQRGILGAPKQVRPSPN
jgi:ATP/maltotriose-dependent transcriptional regulator MalT